MLTSCGADVITETSSGALMYPATMSSILCELSLVSRLIGGPVLDVSGPKQQQMPKRIDVNGS